MTTSIRPTIELTGRQDLDDSLAELLAVVAAGASGRDQDRSHPREVVQLIKDFRLGALRVPVLDGGFGLSIRELFSVVIALGEADSNVAHITRNHFHFAENILRNPDRRIRDKWLPVIQSGALVGLASAELGKQVGGSAYGTRLTKTADGLILEGTKYYSTGTLYADYISVTASDDDNAPVTVVVPSDRSGVERIDDWDGIGQRLTGTGTTIFHRVLVDESEVITREPGGSNNFPHHATFPGLFLTGIIAGILRSGIDDAVTYLHQRQRTFSTASNPNPSRDPLLQVVIGKAASIAYASRAAVLDAAAALDASAESAVDGVPDSAAAHEAELRSSLAKVFVDDAAVTATSTLFDVGGASATKRIHNLDRHWRNSRTLASHNPALYRARNIGDLEINGTTLPQGILS